MRHVAVERALKPERLDALIAASSALGDFGRGVETLGAPRRYWANRETRRVAGKAVACLRRRTKVPGQVKAKLGLELFERIRLQMALTALGWTVQRTAFA